MDHEILLLARIVEHATVGIVLLKADGVVHYANLLAQQMLGCHREDLIGKPLTEYVSEMSGEVSWEELLKRILNDKQGQARVLLQSGKRETIICKLDYFHVDINGNQQEHIALIFRDITSDLRLAEQLEKKNLETAKMNSELIRSNSELKRVSELKSNFLSIASHELKTPLTSIKGYSDIIIDNMQDKLDSGIYRMVESINRATDRLHKVVNNILDVTRIEQKRLRLKPEMLNWGR